MNHSSVRTNGGDRPDVPAWFSSAIASRPACSVVTCDAVPIHYRTWPAATAAERPGLLLVHGSAAHSGWWDHLAPLLAIDRSVVALDLSGHGDSGWRDHYDMSCWGKEVRAVAAAAGLWPRVVLIGHSLGGLVAFEAARGSGGALGGTIMIDSLIVKRTPEDRLRRQRRAAAPWRIYADRSSALSAYRTLPSQPEVLRFVRSHIAETAIRRVPGGWTWKSDPVIYSQPDPAETFLAEIDTPLAILYGEHGLIDAHMLATMRGRLGPVAQFRQIPGAGHHIMLDKPCELARAIREVLADWPTA